ncbi:NADH-quinone oxidoreductase subunit M [Microlunatus antarcticus]|uniref:NADH-quinone oxidoreductase subunit M n=1 Tax=Microlunatus antarcticus TaxID=53388 RepID=A0A7W5JZT0_9ACTN|nr:NADH-quinone oxidoreductase subunit M [Microlunatus antarcticus]MBB3328712.1 NADH-quinone oxidoreductase subunit M [Microlunatus antarcticus]
MNTTSGVPWLTVLALLPALGAVVVLLGRSGAAKVVALATSLVTVVLAVVLTVGLRGGGGMELSEDVVWIGPLGAHYALGLDGIGATLVLLASIVTPVVVLATWGDYDRVPAPGTVRPAGEPARYDSKVFFALVLAVQTCALYLFLATDVFLFYVFFEVVLVPMYFLIGGFGPGARRSKAAAKFLIFGLLGGFVMLASVIGLYVASAQVGTPSYLLSDLSGLTLGTGQERWLFIGFMFAFAIKAPLVPLHTWLPDAAEQSSPGGATMMVGIMDKIGTFGMIRFCLGLFPEASQWATPVVIVLAVLSIVYGAVLAIGSKNLMRFVAYTSISHFGFIVLGIFVLTRQTLTGSTFYMLNHGLSTAALFLVAGYLVKRRGSADIADFGGVQKVAPVAAGLLLFAGLSTLSLPGLSSFVSEFMVLAGTFGKHPVYAGVATLAIVLAALYILVTYQRTMTGPVAPAVAATVTEVSTRERLAIAPLVVLILVLGVYPKPVLALIEPSTALLQTSVGVSDPAPLVGGTR